MPKDMLPEKNPFKFDQDNFMPTLSEDLVYLIKYSYSRVRNLLGRTSSASELEINNGISELAIKLRRKPISLGAVFRLRRKLSLQTDLSCSEAYCEAVRGAFLELFLKTGNIVAAHEFYEEFKRGVDFTQEIREGFFHLCTEALPVVHVTRISGGVKSEESLGPEHWIVDNAINLYNVFKRHIDFKQVCEEAIAHLLRNGRREDAQTLYNAFKNKVQLSSFDNSKVA